MVVAASPWAAVVAAAPGVRRRRGAGRRL